MESVYIFLFPCKQETGMYLEIYNLKSLYEALNSYFG